MPTRRTTICIMAKEPRPGAAKTRLAPAVGRDQAMRLAEAFLRDTCVQVAAIEWADPVVATTCTDLGQRLGLPEGTQIWLQGEGDLGARIERVARRALERDGDRVIIIGADTPGLPSALLQQAMHALDEVDCAFGPSEDGGFYLLALRRCPRGLLAGLPWSCADTGRATLAQIVEQGLRVTSLPSWFDIDLPEDLYRLRRSLERGLTHAPHTAAVLGCIPAEPGLAHSISVVMPTYNEGRRLAGALRRIGAVPGLSEILVADGGSTDETLQITRNSPLTRLVNSPLGRGQQLNAGADRAQGDVLLFVHADVSLPADAAWWIEETLRDPRCVGGAFRTWTVAEAQGHPIGSLLHLADIRSRYTGVPYGDQAMFVRTDVFRSMGGFAEMPLMEDYELSRRLRKRGRVRTVPATVRVSGRRFQKHPLWYTLLVNTLPLLYRAGISPETLARIYGNVR